MTRRCQRLNHEWINFDGDRVGVGHRRPNLCLGSGTDEKHDGAIAKSFG